MAFDRVTPDEVLQLKIGPARVTAVWLLSGPMDGAVALQQVQAMVAASPRFRNVVQRARGWYRWQAPAQFEIGAHIHVLEAPELFGQAGVDRMINAIRRQPLDPDRPLWRAFLVNPQGASPLPGDPVSALVLHYDHVIADGVRISRHVATTTRHGTNGDGGQGAPVLADMSRVSMADLAATHDPRIAEVTAVTCSVARQRLSDHGRTGLTMTERLILSGARLLDGPMWDLRGQRRPRRTGRVAMLELTRRATDAARLGNHLRASEARVLRQGRAAANVRFRKRVNSTGLVALSAHLPGAILRPFTRLWFRLCDQVFTLIPAGRQTVRLGGQEVRAIYGAPPILGDTPLTLSAVSYRHGVHVTAFSPRTDPASRADLASCLERGLTGTSGPQDEDAGR